MLTWKSRGDLSFAYVFSLSLTILCVHVNFSGARNLRNTSKVKNVFVSYAYCEKARTSAPDNLLYFLREGVSQSVTQRVDYGIVVNGRCSKRQCVHPGEFSRSLSDQVYLWRRENEGFDFGAHSHALRHLFRSGRYFDYYIFLNSGVAGPFPPSFMPKGWHWTSAFIDRIAPSVGIVGSSVTCLPSNDLGGSGPSLEGFTFALSRFALSAVLRHGTSFSSHRNKMSAILGGEYSLTDTVLQAGLKVDSLLSAYLRVDWNNANSWLCNNLTHPSRANSYFGNSFHPIEVLFHKVQWGYEISRGTEAKESGKVSAPETELLTSMYLSA